MKWIFENQHKFQTVRSCSSSLRYKELEENAAQAQAEHVAPPMTAADDKPRPHITPEISFKVSAIAFNVKSKTALNNAKIIWLITFISDIFLL